MLDQLIHMAPSAEEYIRYPNMVFCSVRGPMAESPAPIPGAAVTVVRGAGGAAGAVVRPSKPASHPWSQTTAGGHKVRRTAAGNDRAQQTQHNPQQTVRGRPGGSITSEPSVSTSPM